MNKKILLFLLMLLPLVASAQTKRNIHVAKAGTLPELIPEDEMYQIEDLTLSGELNGTDLYFIRKMAGVIAKGFEDLDVIIEPTDGILKTLNLAESNIVEGGGSYSHEYYGMLSQDEEYTMTNALSVSFFSCTKIENITIPKSVVLITNVNNRWRNGNSIISIKVPNGNPKYDSRNDCNAIIETATNRLILGCKNTTIPNSVTSIGDGAFLGRSGLTSIMIPSSVTSIGENAFAYCGLTSLTLPSSVTSIGEGAFEHNSGLAFLTLPSSVTSIGENAFWDCTGLTSVTIPNSVRTIGYSAFYGCTRLTTIVSEIENPFAIDESVFKCYGKDLYATATLFVPPGKKYAYQNTAGWNKFPNIVEAELVGYEFERNGIRYKMGGNNTVSVTSKPEKYTGDIVIPSVVKYNGENYSVNNIKFSAFEDCIGLISITIPPSIKGIEEEAFDGCNSLNAVHISDLDAWYNIRFMDGINETHSSNPLRQARHLYLNGVEVKELIIPNSITSIKYATFDGCSGLNSITIPNSVISIGGCAFQYCSGLASITIPNSVMSIGYSAFSGCSGLIFIETEIENPFAISDDVFYCTDKDIYATATLVVPPGKKSAYQSTAGWNKFQNIVEANGGGKEFEANGIRYLIGENNTVSVTSKPEKYTGAVSIPSQVYYDGNNYTVTAIAQSAFEGCIDMTSVTIPSSVTTIGGAAFYYCTGLTTVDIPNGVKTIGEGAFSKCGGLTSVTIPGSVTSIGKNAFFQCYGLTQITSGIENPFAIDDGVFPSSVYTNAFLQVPSGRKSAYQNTAGWKRFQNIAEANGGNKEFEANGVRYLIGENNTVSVTSKTEKYTGVVSIPNQVSFNGNNYTVTSIASSAFEGCTGLTSVTIPSSVTIIGGAAFYMCTGLKTVDIPNGVRTIGEGAFSKCGGLTSVTIPGSVTSIGKNAFFQCYGLIQISCGIENPFAIDDGVFPTSVYNSASLIVPFGTKSSYQNTSGWKRFQNIVEASVVGKEFEANGIRYKIGENNTVSVTSKPEKYIGAVSIPSQVNYNGTNYSVTSIGSSAFEGCIDMTSVSIPSSVTTIGGAAFYYCTGLTTVDIPDGVKTIGEGAFSKCGGLTSVSIPGSVTSIGNNAFFQCYGLTKITSMIENPFAIDDGVFPTSVYNNASLFIPSGKKSAYQNTAGWKRFQNIYYADGIYTLTYYVDGVEYKSVTYSYGAGITPEPAPTKEGYTFSGWIDLPETMPNHDVTVTGTFTLNKYKLTYKIDGEVYQTYLLEYGATITPEAEPTKEGYTFSGWSYIPEKMPADEVTIVGSFTINQYTITYMIDGEKYASETVDYNSKIVPPTPASKDGFDFAWEEYPEMMPAHDITINGAYTTTGILSIALESGKAKIFTLDGRQVDTPQKGINIIRMDDGTIKKVVLGK